MFININFKMIKKNIANNLELIKSKQLIPETEFRNLC